MLPASRVQGGAAADPPAVPRCPPSTIRNYLFALSVNVNSADIEKIWSNLTPKTIEEKVAQRRKVTCLRSHSKSEVACASQKLILSFLIKRWWS